MQCLGEGKSRPQAVLPSKMQKKQGTLFHPQLMRRVRASRQSPDITGAVCRLRLEFAVESLPRTHLTVLAAP